MRTCGPGWLFIVQNQLTLKDVFKKVRIAWVFAAAVAVSAGIGIYHLDLLRAAFAQNPIPRSPQSINRGRQLFHQYCEACHGAGGSGDGPAAASLRTRPEDLTKIAPPPIFPDGVVAYRIANGVEIMPAWKGVLSTDDIWNLINFIRSLHH
jgi:mono/diheme cytochrome c family protein